MRFLFHLGLWGARRIGLEWFRPNLSLFLESFQSSCNNKDSHPTPLNTTESLILKTDISREKIKKKHFVWFSRSWILWNHKNVPLEWNFNSTPFVILRMVAIWRAQYDESCKLCLVKIIVFYLYAYDLFFNRTYF